MKAEEYFNSQADFNKWLKELTEHEKSHVIEMLEEYAAQQAPVEERRCFECGELLNKEALFCGECRKQI